MKRTALVPLIAFDRASEAPFYRQIYEGLRLAILRGRLQHGQRLPSSRALARELGISRLPVLSAFEQLLHEGYVVGRAGAGTYVKPVRADTERTAPTDREHVERNAAPRSRAGRSESAESAVPQDLSSRPFRLSMPALDRFPRDGWARLVSRHARRMTPELMAYGDPAGYLPLREAIADYVRTARAVSCDVSQVIVVAGSQMALRLCALALLAPRDEVAVEEPGYPGAWSALTATGATLRPVPVDDHGLIVERLAKPGRSPRALYVTPSHQYPLGVSMTASRRMELLEWAHRRDVWIIEDDYDSEYRFASRPLGALQGMAPDARVVYVGTFSKVLFPALRIGYLVVPHALRDVFLRHRDAMDIFSPTLYQSALSEFISDGHFARHVRKMRSVYLQRRDALLDSIRQQWTRTRTRPTVSVVNADAGMHLSAWLPDGVDDVEVVRRAASVGVNVTALSSCFLRKPSKGGLVLGFGGFAEDEIRLAAKRLAKVLR